MATIVPYVTDDHISGRCNFLVVKPVKSDNLQGVHVSRMEIEQWAVERRMTPKYAAHLFEDLEGLA